MQDLARIFTPGNAPSLSQARVDFHSTRDIDQWYQWYIVKKPQERYVPWYQWYKRGMDLSRHIFYTSMISGETNLLKKCVNCVKFCQTNPKNLLILTHFANHSQIQPSVKLIFLNQLHKVCQLLSISTKKTDVLCNFLPTY